MSSGNSSSNINTTAIDCQYLSDNFKEMFSLEDFSCPINESLKKVVNELIYENNKYETDGYNVLIGNVNKLAKFCILNIFNLKKKSEWTLPDDIYNWIIDQVADLIYLSNDSSHSANFKKHIWRSTFVFFSLLLASCFTLDENLQHRLINNTHNSTHYKLIVRVGIKAPKKYCELNEQELTTKELIDVLKSILIPNIQTVNETRLMKIAVILTGSDTSCLINFRKAAIVEVIQNNDLNNFFFISPVKSFLGGQTVFKGLHCQILATLK